MSARVVRSIVIATVVAFGIGNLQVAASPTKITAKDHEGQRKVGGVLDGYTSGNITTYAERDTINFRFDLAATHGPSSGDLEVRFTGDDGTCLFFDPYFVLGAIENLGGAEVPTITVTSGPTAQDFGTSSGEWVVTLHIDYPQTFDHTANEVQVNYQLRLSDEAGSCNGSSQHSRLNPAGGVVEQTGAQNVPVPASQVIELAVITAQKVVDSGSATPDQWCFNISPNPQNESLPKCPAPGEDPVTFTGLPTGNYTITETNVPGYSFASGEGTNCTFQGEVATASVEAAPEPTDATCIFHNAREQGSIELAKEWIGQGGQTTLNIGTTAGGSHVDTQLTGPNGTPPLTTGPNIVDPGTYFVSETGGLAGFHSTLGCVNNEDSPGVPVAVGANGAVDVGADDVIVCTFTNTREASLTIVKNTIGGNATFDFNGTGTNVPVDFDITTSGGTGSHGPITFTPTQFGPKSITETELEGWTLTDLDCDGDDDFTEDGSTASLNIEAGETVVCTFENTRNASLRVVKNTVGGNDTFSFDATGANLADFDITTVGGTGSHGPIAFTPDQFGTKSITELPLAGWTFTGLNCTGDDDFTENGSTANLNIEAGETVVCTFENAALATVTVTKTEAGGPPTRTFTFTLHGPNGFNETQTTTLAPGGDTLVWDGLLPGTYILCESVEPGYESSLGSAEGGQACTEPFTVAAGADLTFDVDNIPCPDGSLTISREIPSGTGPATFTYTIDRPAPLSDQQVQLVFDGNDTFKSTTISTPIAGDYTITESGPARFTPLDPITVSIDPPECAAQAAFVGDLAPVPPAVRVIKTEQLSPDSPKRAALGKWTFSLIGPDAVADGVFNPNDPNLPVSTKVTNTGGGNHKLNWRDLAEGDYRLCEKFFGGWRSNLGGSNAIILPNGDRCVDFSLSNDEVAVFRVNNRCPSGGFAVPR